MHGNGAYGRASSYALPFKQNYTRKLWLLLVEHGIGALDGLVTIKFRPYTVEPEGINGIIPGQGGAPLTVSGGGPNGEHYEWPRRSGDWYFDPDSQ